MDHGEWSAALEILEDIVPALRRFGDGTSRSGRTGHVHGRMRSSETESGLGITEENLEDARAHGHKRIEARSLGSLAERAAD